MNSENLIPDEGLYVSKKDPSVRMVVTEVDVVDDEERDSEDVFYLVNVVREGDEDDMSAMGYEFDPDEWQKFVATLQLEYVPEKNASISELRELLSKVKKH